MQVEHGTFTPLVMRATGGMGRESRKFCTRLSEIIFVKRKENYTFIPFWIRRKISFAFVHVYVAEDLFTSLQAHAHRNRCFH